MFYVTFIVGIILLGIGLGTQITIQQLNHFAVWMLVGEINRLVGTIIGELTQLSSFSFFGKVVELLVLMMIVGELAKFSFFQFL